MSFGYEMGGDECRKDNTKEKWSTYIMKMICNFSMEWKDNLYRYRNVINLGEHYRNTRNGLKESGRRLTGYMICRENKREEEGRMEDYGRKRKWVSR